MTIASSPPQHLHVCFGGYSTAGIKPENQDAFAAKQPKDSALKYKGVVACIADGVSASAKAQEASQTAVADFIGDYYSTPDSWAVKDAAAKVMSSLNAWLYHHSQQGSASSMLTTFSAAVLKSNSLHLLHVGDSRVYRFRAGSLEQLTRDHNLIQGDNIYLKKALGMEPRLEVDYHRESLEEGDILVLTTDGVHEFITSKQMRAELRDAEPTEKGLEHAAKNLVELALSQKSNDNVSCLLVAVKDVPEPDLDEAHRQLAMQVIPPVMSEGNSIDDYVIDEVIYSGTRSHVYRVHDKTNRQRLVLKAPSSNYSEDSEYLDSFIREQWVGRRINHSNVMKIMAPAQTSKFLYHLCEDVPGISLRQWMHDNQQPSLDAVRAIVSQLIKGMRAFQRASMIHRDLKPENILIDAKGTVKIVDFGTVQVSGLKEIASPLREDDLVGAVNYIAPEYMLNEPGTNRSDTFSLGVIIYEMVTGTLPFKTMTPHSRNITSYADLKYLSAQQRRRDIPQWLDLALKKACSPSPRERYSSLSELEKDIREPNKAMLSKLEKAPLVERNPLLFWKGLSLILFICCIGLLVSR